MIIGIGNDYVDIQRIEKAISAFGSHFITKVFTAAEQDKANSRQGNPKAMAATYAKRWAAKEAFSKALGTGMRGISWQEIEVVNLDSGKPTLNIYGKAKEKLAALTPAGKTALVNLTLTDDYPKASAVVIISAE